MNTEPRDEGQDPEVSESPAPNVQAPVEEAEGTPPRDPHLLSEIDLQGDSEESVDPEDLMLAFADRQYRDQDPEASGSPAPNVQAPVEEAEGTPPRDPHLLSEIDLQGDSEESVDLEDLMLAFADRPSPPPSTVDPPRSQAGEGASVVREHLKGLLEALIFASDKPQRASDLAKIATADVREVRELLSTLRQEYLHRGIQLDEVAGGWIFRTSPAYAPFVRESTGKKPVRLARAQLETLAILAYRQPVTRPEIDDIRGVDSGGALKALLERDLVRILGRKDEPGRPVLYGTSNRFLELFQMKSLRDLPALREFTELTEESLRIAEDELADAAAEAPEAPKLPQEAYEDPPPDGPSG